MPARAIECALCASTDTALKVRYIDVRPHFTVESHKTLGYAFSSAKGRGPMTVFSQIINREIPADIVYEDELCLAFRDIDPQAPTHILVIPKKPIMSMADVKADDRDLLGHLMVKASEVAQSEGISESGYRLVINTNKMGGQAVDHLHVHILGGRAMHWPPG